MLTDSDVLGFRGRRNEVDPFRPYGFFVEPERAADGAVLQTTTILLSNRECPFRCLMCDLWKNTTTSRVPSGAIPEQIRFALAELPPGDQIKLYNSGNFFDRQAIPSEDFPRIAAQVAHFQRVIVECHPKLTGIHCAKFQQLVGTQLEVAMGLETSHAETLQLLNKQMTTADFARACEELLQESIDLRAFILLRPPQTTEQQGIERAIESVRFAFDCGVQCCVVIPVRAGNGIMDHLQVTGRFSPPKLSSLETVVEETLALHRGRVFADLWDLAQFSTCAACVDKRIRRLEQTNLTQRVSRQVTCPVCG